MLTISRYIEAIDKAVCNALTDGFDVLDSNGHFSWAKINESISLRSWVGINDIDDDLFRAAIAAYRAQLGYEKNH